MTLTSSRQLQTGIVGSLVVHGLLMLLLILGVTFSPGKWTPHTPAKPKPKPKPQKQVVMIYPSQLVPVPPPIVKPKPKPKTYIRTTQNEGVAKAPSNPAFASDRNTVAASKKAASPDATLPMPTTSGIKIEMGELANRDYRDGKLANDALPKALAMPKMLAPPPQAQPPPPQPVSATPPPPAPVPPAKPVQVAKADPGAAPLAKMIEDMDREAVRLQVNRLPLEVRKPGEPPQPPKAIPVPPSPPQPQIVKAVPVSDAMRAPGPDADKDAFVPFTRTSAVKGTITNRGEDAVDAERTPMGVYKRSVNAAVEKKWHIYRVLKKDAVTYGSLKVRFYVTKAGRAEDLKVISDPRDADPRMTDFTLRAIMDAEIPPIPEELLPTLEDDRVKIEYDVLIY